MSVIWLRLHALRNNNGVYVTALSEKNFGLLATIAGMITLAGEMKKISVPSRCFRSTMFLHYEKNGTCMRWETDSGELVVRFADKIEMREQLYS